MYGQEGHAGVRQRSAFPLKEMMKTFPMSEGQSIRKELQRHLLFRTLGARKVKRRIPLIFRWIKLANMRGTTTETWMLHGGMYYSRTLSSWAVWTKEQCTTIE